MCKYCDDDNYFTEKVRIRNNIADDNMCENIRDYNCENCDGCSDDKNYFQFSYYNDFTSCYYYREIKDENGKVFISGQSCERINRNYCHNCGRKLTKEE